MVRGQHDRSTDNKPGELKGLVVHIFLGIFMSSRIRMFLYIRVGRAAPKRRFHFRLRSKNPFIDGFHGDQGKERWSFLLYSFLKC